jgi:hypothetical protein
MSIELKLNNLLNLSTEELSNTKIKFNQYNGNTNPIDEYKANPEIVNNQWLFWRTDRRYFKVNQTAICFLKISYDIWLLTTIKKITKELNVQNGINYEGEEIEQFKPYFGRVIVKYHKNHLTQGVNADKVMDKLEVVQILPSIFDGDDFPGYDNVRLSYKQLKTIIDRNKKDWIAALENQKAVYLITDTHTGKLYVGSAYGDNGMLLQRWKNYVNSGHGGNKEFKSLSFDYIKENFQYSILENYNASVDKHIILQRESWWKDTLKSKEFGYNEN